jgi:hypothetical protein
MPRRYLSFDIEIARIVPDPFDQWRSHRPLGICCAATFLSDEPNPKLWHGKTTTGLAAPQMSQPDCQALVQYLQQKSDEGYEVLTWNGLNFDFDVLAEESNALEDCAHIARNHVDMMFHLVCSQGHRLALAKAAQGMNIPGKPAGMSGDQAPILWSQGKHDQVLAYVAQDVRIALDVAVAVEAARRFHWMTTRGTRKSITLPRGWLRVVEALLLPEPDTSWMSSPPQRKDFFTWLSTTAPLITAH